MRYLLIVFMLLVAVSAGAGDIIYRVHTQDDKSGVDVKSLFVGDPAVKELMDAAEGVLPYLELGNEPTPSFDMIHPIGRMPIPPAQQLRDKAKAIEERDAAIKRFRDALEKARR